MTFHDPLMAAGGKAVLLMGPFGAAERVIDLDRPMAIAEIIAAHELTFALPTIAVLDGEPVMRGTWAVRVIRPGEVIAFVAVPRGGGEGSGQGKQIIGMIAALALSIAAPMIGGFVAGAFFGGSALAASLVSGALLVGGSMLLNALMPPPSQDSGAAADPVYSVTAASNQATPLEPLPVLYGRLRFVLRHASRPYSEYSGNDQYLYQLFHVTAGKADIEQIDIGETEAWSAEDGYAASFSDLQFQIVQPGEAITLFPANVVTSGEVSGQTVPDPSAVLGPFVVNAAGTTVDRLAVDFAFPGGLWTANGKAVDPNSIALRAQYQEIDNDGSPVGGWVNLFAETVSAATRTPQRMSRSAAVTAGRYWVRFLADEAFDADDATAVNRVVWTGLRGYLTDFVTPPGCTLLAMKVRANEQLTQLSSNQIRVTAERYLPVWDEGAGWEEQKTRSIAWAAADLLMNSDYSIGLSPAQFDLAQLAVLAETWATRGDTFNAIFDRSWTLQEALRATLRAGRTQAVRMGGRIGFVRLEPKQIRRAVFSPRNVVRGSFSHKLVLFDEEKPDCVVGSFIDETIWQQREVTASLAAIGSDLPQKIDWFGITDHGQAWRESVTEAAVNAYNREFVSFTADWEGKLLVRGEPILVQHPFIEGVDTVSLAGRAGDVLTIDRDPAVVTGDPYVILRGKTGQEWGPCLVDSIVGRTITLNAADRAVVAAAMGSLASILPSGRSERATVLICDGETRPFNGLVVSAVPSSSGKVDVLAVIDAPEVYLADGTEAMPSPWAPPTLPPQNPARPLVLGLYAELRAGIAQLELDAMWQPSAGVIGGYVAEVSYDLSPELSDDERRWTPVHRGQSNRFTTNVLPQNLILRVAAIGVLQGPWARKTFLLADVPDVKVPPSYMEPIGPANILDNSIVASKIADAAVTAIKLMDEAVTSLKLADSAVTTAKLAVAAVTSDILASGAVIADKIASGAVTIAKFATGLTPVEVVTSLPTSGNFEGRQVYLTTDDKLYRHTGSPSGAAGFIANVAAADITGTLADAQIAAVAAAKITGQLTDAQIAALAAAKLTGQITTTQITDNAVTTAKVFAGSITTAKLDASAVTADKLAANAVTAVKIDAGSVTTAKLATGAVVADSIASGAVTTAKLDALAVTAAKLAANSVIAGKIAAGVVTATEIAARAIVTSRLAVGDWTNLVPNADLTESAAWSFSATGEGTIVGPNGVYAAGNLIRFDGDYTAGSGTTYIGNARSTAFPVTAGQVLAFGGVIDFNSGTTGGVTLQIMYYSTEAEAELPHPSDTYWFGSSQTLGFTDYPNASANPVSGQHVVPDGARFARLYWRRRSTSNAGSVSGIVYVHSGFIRVAQTAELIVDGAIIAAKIDAGAVTTAKLAAGSVTAGTIATGAITTDKLAANSVVASKIAANTITSDKMVANSITARELVLVDFSNMFPDQNFTLGDSDWTFDTDWSAGWDFVSNSQSTGLPALEFQFTVGGTSSGEYARAFFNPRIPVEAGKPYVAGGVIDAYGSTNGRATYGIYWFDASNTFISSDWGTDFDCSSSASEQVIGNASAVAPATAVSARLIMRVRAPSAGGTLTARVHFRTPYLRRAANAELIVDGAVTADKLSANSVVAGKLAANSINTSNLFVDSVVITDVIANNAVSGNAVYTMSSAYTYTTGSGTGISTEVTFWTFNVTPNRAGRVRVLVTGTVGTDTADNSAYGTVRIRIKRAGSTQDDREVAYDEDGANAWSDGTFTFLHAFTAANTSAVTFTMTIQGLAGGRWYCKVKDAQAEQTSLAK